MVNFVRQATKKSLLSFLKNPKEADSREWRRLFDALLFKDELESYLDGGGTSTGGSSGSTSSPLGAFLKKDGSTKLTSDWDAGSQKIRAKTLQSDVPTGTAPLTVASTTVVTNLNADLFDGQTGSYYLDSDNFTGTEWTDLTDSGETAIHGHAISGISFPVTTQTAATLTLGATHYTVLCDGTSNTVTITLPTASGITGRIYNIKAINIDNAVTVDQTGAETIDDSTAVITLALMETITVQSDGTNWWII